MITALEFDGRTRVVAVSRFVATIVTILQFKFQLFVLKIINENLSSTVLSMIFLKKPQNFRR